MGAEGRSRLREFARAATQHGQAVVQRRGAPQQGSAAAAGGPHASAAPATRQRQAEGRTGRTPELALLRSIESELMNQRRYLETLRATAAGPILDDVQRFSDERRLGYLETLDHLYDNRMSFARFGDGELRLMLRDDYNLGFQRNSVELQRALRALFTDEKYRDKVLLGFPYVAARTGRPCGPMSGRSTGSWPATCPSSA
jgi:hypothetical protein